ncbi:ATP-binding protein [Methanobrevibacter filiformis]|uniref:Putative AAA-ATPase n=1 Tax=Methanobrevibacter filiformis TaxID=55758 RepID=A0A166DAS0_9EURY|nr:ATP-binding protein [Methanobrevibacter filiformis]KZX15389.1 putative AAA-ATPase [Methanobrevibacter filiformis]
MKDLPLDIGTFSNLIENDYIYVDKTKFIHEIYKPGKKFFLSRPRRFGKSLFVSTLKELFKGNKQLFKDLYIYDKWDWDETYPVIHLDLSVDSTSSDELKNSLNDLIERIARDFSVKLCGSNLKSRFGSLIIEIHKKHNQNVVVLIDEYDKPIIDNITHYDLAEANRKILNNFYGVLKSNDEFIQFIFLTGVTKFSKTSIFSGLNNVTDITLTCPNICGYTQEELEYYFKEYVVKFTKDNNISNLHLLSLIKKWYNGYSWDGENRVYNPYSILSLFFKGQFNNYWFESGTPSFLIDFIRNNSNINVLFNSNKIIRGEFPNFHLKKLDFTTLLLQTGYLTIKEVDIVVGELPSYTLDIPNKEVNDSLFTSIITDYTNEDSEDVISLSSKILNEIIKIDNNGLQNSFNNLISSIPSLLYGNIKKKDLIESFYHGMLLSWFKLMGFFIEGEVLTSKGRLDAVLKKGDLIIIIEIKYSLTESLDKLIDKAISQIKDKKYYSPYIDYNVVLLGVAFGDRSVKSHVESLNIQMM